MGSRRTTSGGSTTRRRTGAVVAVLSMMGSLFGALAMPTPASATNGPKVDPIEFDGNPSCDDVDPEADWTEFKLEEDDVADGKYVDGTLEVEITLTGDDDQFLEWSSNIGVDAVIVKGGPNANAYVYDPEETSDSGLRSPDNEAGEIPAISHVTFCYDLDPDYELEKTADAEMVNAGDPVGFTITLDNFGPVDLIDATISDQLPSAGTLDWNEDPDVAECDIDGDGLLTCSLGDVPSGEQRSVHVTATTNAQTCGPLDNTAISNTGNAGERDAQASATVLCPTVAIDKVTSDGVDEDSSTSDDETFNAGDTIGFDILVTIGGKGVATDVEVSDTLPTLPSGGTWTINPAVEGCEIVGQELTCTFDELEAGSEVLIHVEAPTTAEDCGSYENLAEVTSSNDGSDEDDASVTVQCPNVKVDKKALDGVDEDGENSDSETVDAGTPTGFTIVVTNEGPGAATNVTLSDTLPSGIEWAEDPDNPDCEITGNELSCDFGTLAEGEQVEVTVTGMTAPENCGSLENTVTISADGDTNQQDNSSSATVRVRCPDLKIEKTADAPSVDAGDQIGFTITLTNDGPGTALGASLDDTLPGGPGISWEIESQTAEPPCELAGNELTCDPRDLPAGESIVIHVVSDTAFASCEVYDNTAVGDANNDDEVKANASTEVLCADLVIEKTADDESVSAGDPIGFTIEARNDGDGTAKDVTISDALPAGSGLLWSESPDNPDCEISGAQGNQTLECGPIEEAEPGWTLSVHVVSQTGQDDCAGYQNVAVIGATNHPEVDTQASTQVLCPGLNVAKTADAPSVSAGEQIGFTIEVGNDGPGEAKDVTLDDELPTGDGIDWEIESTSGVDAGCELSGDDELSCGPVDLPAEQGFSVHVVSDTAFVGCGAYDNTAVADASNDDEMQSSARTEVLCPDLEINKTTASEQVDAGEPIGFAVTVNNLGPGTAFDVTLEDELPGGDGIEWQIVDQFGGAGCTIADGTLTCGPVDLGPEEGFGVAVRSQTAFESCSVYDNSAVAVASNQDGELEASASTEVLCPDISITKTADADRVDAGEDIGFTVEVTNEGPGTALDLTVVDDLPTGPGIMWSEDPDNPDCEIFQGTLTCDLTELPGGDSISVHVTSPTTEQACATYENVATVGARNHPEQEADDSTDVICPDEEPPPPSGPLPFTGAQTGTLVTLAGILLAGGGAALLASKGWRRREGGVS